MEACQHHSTQVVVLTQRTPAPAYNVVTVSRDRTGLQRRGRLSHPHRFKMLRSTHLSAPTDDPPVIDFNFTVVIINSAVDNFWHDTSGDIHLKYILLAHIIFCQRAVYLCLGLQYC